MSKYSKLVGAIVGALTSVPITTLVPGLPAAWATVITGVLAAVGACVAPKNTP
ncbi:hypothetical protein ACFORO_42425 [Amycolatopsis halotolerans]|uniref:Uncharacterized protein n=1 Tax=Amycolatopsis halotolerans TaxID=330083 RepID=A0ABV7QXB3_9PSEU